jgi:hypothetical protein
MVRAPSAGVYMCQEGRRRGMWMLGSHSWEYDPHDQSTRPYAGRPNGDVRDPALMRLAREHVDEASIAERDDSPATYSARLRLDDASGSNGLHRMHPDHPVWAISTTQGYQVEPHLESKAACESEDRSILYAAESISFMCTDPGCTTYFYVSGTLLRLPDTLWQVVRVYIPYPRCVYHGALPRTVGAGQDEAHGNVGSALVTRCHPASLTPCSHPPSLPSHEPCGSRAAVAHARVAPWSQRATALGRALFHAEEGLPQGTKDLHPWRPVFCQVTDNPDELYFKAMFNDTVPCRHALHLPPGD